MNNAEFPIVCVLHSETHLPHHDGVHYIKMQRQPELYAHDLYRTLRLLDQQGFQHILIESVPEEKEWDAIRDRLSKASQSRPQVHLTSKL